MDSNAGDIAAPTKEDDVAKAGPTRAALAPAPPPPATTQRPPKPAAVVDEVPDEYEDVPDPDEDDLDDLDDMLDEFSAVKIESQKPPAPSRPGIPSPAGGGAAAATEEDGLSEEDFAKQLQDGMAGLLGELEPEMQAQFENIFKELGAAAAAGGGAEPVPATVAGGHSGVPRGAANPAAAAAPPVASSAEASFQETIRQTMERMQAGGAQATAAAAAEGSDDFLAELLKQMQSGELDGEGGESGAEDFSKMLMGMMDQLTNKEILYEPMKELNDKFPEWLDKNADKTSKDDLQRYHEQQALVKEIVSKFEEPTYSDANKADREYIVDRMQKMQASGSPPDDLVGDMPSTQDALNMPDESCNPQ